MATATIARSAQEEQGTGSKAQLMVLLLGALVTMFNVSVTNVALPSIAAALNATGEQIHLIADGYAIALTSFVLLAGAIGDRYGRKRMFLVGAGLIVPASILTAYASSANQVIIYRMLAGLASAALFPTTLSMITSIYQDKQERIKAIAMWSGVAAFGAALAPVIAGALLEHFWWGSTFLVSAPLAGLAFVAGIIVLREPPSHHSAPVDWVGGGLTVVMVSTLLFSVIILPTEGLSSHTLMYLGIFATATVLFVLRELRIANPLLDLRVFRIRRFSISAIAMLVLSIGLAGVMYLAAQYTQSVLEYGTLEAGLAALPLTLSVLAVSPVAAKLDGKYGSKLVVSAGLVVVALGFGTGMLWSSSSPYLLLAFTYLLIGIGLGLAMAPVTNAIMNSLPEEKAGIGSAVNDLMRDLGSALGIAINGSLATVTYTKLVNEVYVGLPPEQQSKIPDDVYTVIRSSLTGALEVAKRYESVYPAASEKLVLVAREAFIAGQSNAMLVGAALCAACAVLTWFLLPSE